VTAGSGPAPLRGLVLAGGRSRRLGQDKAALPLDGESLLERAVALLRRVVPDAHVAVRPDQLADPLRRRFALLPDAFEDVGPAAGVLAAQSFDPAAAWLVLACDMPRVDAAVLAALVAGRDSRRGATAFRAAADGLPEPLCAIYEPATLTNFRRQVEAGGHSGLRELIAGANPVLLDAPGPDALASVNTPGDVERLTSR
jgi:molybdopterin-guanine dinucleotide biosynthesis protein A